MAGVVHTYWCNGQMLSASNPISQYALMPAVSGPFPATNEEVKLRDCALNTILSVRFLHSNKCKGGN